MNIEMDPFIIGQVDWFICQTKSIGSTYTICYLDHNEMLYAQYDIDEDI